MIWPRNLGVASKCMWLKQKRPEADDRGGSPTRARVFVMTCEVVKMIG